MIKLSASLVATKASPQLSSGKENGSPLVTQTASTSNAKPFDHRERFDRTAALRHDGGHPMKAERFDPSTPTCSSSQCVDRASIGRSLNLCDPEGLSGQT